MMSSCSSLLYWQLRDHQQWTRKVVNRKQRPHMLSCSSIPPGPRKPPHHHMSPSNSPYTSMSPYPSTSSHATTPPKEWGRMLDYQDFLDIQRAWFDRLQGELAEMQLSFERSLHQMESCTHSLLWSMSRSLLSRLKPAYLSAICFPRVFQ